MSGPPDGFRHEVRAQLRTVGNELIEIENDPDPDQATVDEIFRAAHSLKGSCSMAGLDGASTLAHAIEDALDAVRAGELVPNERLVDDALTAVDEIDAALDAFEADEPTPDPEPTRSRLRVTIDAERDAPGSTPEDAVDSSPTAAESTDTAESTTRDEPADSQSGTTDQPMARSVKGPDKEDVLSPPTEQQDISVEEALERASVFDDLDALTADLDEEDTFDDLDKWGTFEDVDDSAVEAPPDEEPVPEEAPASESEDQNDPDMDALNPGTILFEEVKAEVQADGSDSDLDALEADIEAAEFGEFDDQDELTIEELLEADPADVVESEDQDIGAGEVADDGSDEATSFEEVAAAVGPDENLEQLEADIEAEEFGEFDDEDVFTIPELVAAEPEDLDEERALDDPSAADPVDDDPLADEEEALVDPTADLAAVEEDEASDESDQTIGLPESDVDADSDTASPDDGDTVSPDDGDVVPPDGDTIAPDDTTDEIADSTESDDVNPFFTPDLVEEGDDTDRNGDSTEEDSDLPAETESLLNDAAELLGDASDDDAQDSSVDADRIEHDSTDAVEEASDDAGTTTGDAPTTADDTPSSADPDAAGDVDVDTAMADLDELVSASGIDDDVDAVEPDTGDTFARDADVEAFEERFSGLFGESAEDGTPVGRGATTLEGSTLVIEPSETDSAARDTTGIDQIGSVTVDVSVADALLRSVEELSRNHLRLERAFHEEDGPTTQDVLSDLRSVTAGLRETVMDVRLMPLSSVTDDLPRVLRAAARETETEATLEVDGADVTLDRGIIDRLGDPLAHLLRNAVAHGIESSAEREAVGKPRQGTVTISAQRRRDRVHIEVADDGRGLDPGRIRQTAIDQGILTEEAADELTLEEVYDLVFHPGFSTADEVTEVSGRGVGLDVVDRTVTELNGSVEIDSEPGEGTTVRLSLPMSVAVSEVLFVQAGDEEYAIRLSAIERVGKPGEIVTVDGQEMATFDSLVDDTVRVDDGATAGDASSDGGSSSGVAPERYPLLRLSEALDTKRDEPAAEDGVSNETGSDDTDSNDIASDDTASDDTDSHVSDGVLVQLRSDLRDLVLYCDDFGGTQEVVVDPYTGVLGGVPGLSGTTTRGDGSLVNVLDVHSL